MFFLYNLLIYFVVAFAMVDFDGNMDISISEIVDFYKDCFAPIVTFCKDSNFIKGFPYDINKDSFLYYAFLATKECKYYFFILIFL